MRVGLISYPIDYEQRTGIGNYTYYLVKNLIEIGKADNLYLIHYRKFNEEVYSKAHEKIISVPEFLLHIPKIPALISMFKLPFLVKKTEIDILHFPAVWGAQIILSFLNSKVKKILTIHDLTPLLYPYTHKKYNVIIWNSTLQLIKNKIDMIITISQNTKNDCIKYLKIPENRIKVIYLAADKIYQPINNKHEIEEEIYKKYNIQIPFIIYVGTLEKRKNVSTLIKAFYRLKRIKIPHKLVIVGKKGWLYNDIFKTIESMKIQEDVIFTGYVPEEDLVKLYNLADLFVYPSYYEGFGLPPLEAMACGCPVITSNTSSLPEVVGDAGILVDPYDVEGLAKAMYEVLKDESFRIELAKKGLERAKLFSWRKTSEETWKVYEEVYYS
jgi:glycosyltransferase involved in cell wall biosynthesis